MSICEEETNVMSETSVHKPNIMVMSNEKK